MTSPLTALTANDSSAQGKNHSEESNNQASKRLGSYGDDLIASMDLQLKNQFRDKLNF